MEPTSRARAATKHVILFLAANPNDTDRLALDREARAIYVELKRSGYRDRFDFVTRWATEPLDLLRELRELKPTIVHFSGRGGGLAATTTRPVQGGDVIAATSAGGEPRGLYFHRPTGGEQLVSPQAIAQTLAVAGRQVRLVVLSACFTEPVAEALLAHVDCVVGMNGATHNDAARSFAIGFYGGLGEHESIAAAFAQGKAAIDLEGRPDAERPQLKVRDGLDATQLILAAVAPSVLVKVPCPYPETRPYAADDAEGFHGRDGEPAAGFVDVLETNNVPLPARDVSPSMLLAAPFAVVPWHNANRTNVMATLDAWADDAAQPVAVRLLHAPSGTGKTRLAIEWLRRRRSRGDTAGFLPLVIKDDWLARACGPSAPVVAAVDYAEVRADLLAVLRPVTAMAAARRPSRIRVLLLARSDCDWWDALLEREFALKALLTAQEPIELPPFAMDVAERQAAFEEALAAFAKHRRRPVPRAQLPAGDPQFERVLYLHMAALAAVERNAELAGAAGSTESAIVLEAGDLMDEILDHEQRFWLRNRRDRSRAAISLARQIVAAATLRGRIALEAEAKQLCERLSGRERTDADDELLASLHDVYAVNEGGPYLPGLQPDLLGEAMVLRVATKQRDEKWIERVICEHDDTNGVSNAFTVLGRAAAVDPAAISPWLATLLRTELAMRTLPALWAAKAVGQRTAFSPLGDLLADALEQNGTMTIARALTNEPLPFSTVSLRRVAEWRCRMQLADAPSGRRVRRLAKRADLLAEWGLRLISLGKRESALEATRKAVETYRALVGKHPDTFLPDLASSLNNLGALLGAVGQREAALAASRQAVKLLRALAAKHPGTFLSGLADSLNNLGHCASAVGQRKTALAATRRAVKLRRTLAAKHPDTFLPGLVESLSNLGVHLSEVGQFEAALAASRESVDVCRALVAKDPDTYVPHLASSLHSLGKISSDAGQCEAALAATREAIELRRALAAKYTDAFLPDLAMNLNNFGIYLSEVGQFEAALAATREAVNVYRTLVAQNSGAFLPDLAMTLTNLGNRLSQMGQHEAAVDAAREAVELRRPLAAQNSNAFLPDLAGSLLNLGGMLCVVGQREAALDAAREAVEAYRALAAKDSDAFRAELAMSLNNLGTVSRAVGQHEAALDAIRQAVELWRALVAKHPDAFLPNLATSLANLGLQLSAVGQREAALGVTREAVDLRRVLATKYPAAFLPYFAMSLVHLSHRLAETGDHDAASAALRTATEIQSALQAKNPCLDTRRLGARQGGPPLGRRHDFDCGQPEIDGVLKLEAEAVTGSSAAVACRANDNAVITIHAGGADGTVVARWPTRGHWAGALPTRYRGSQTAAAWTWSDPVTHKPHLLAGADGTGGLQVETWKAQYGAVTVDVVADRVDTAAPDDTSEAHPDLTASCSAAAGDSFSGPDPLAGTDPE